MWSFVLLVACRSPERAADRSPSPGTSSPTDTAPTATGDTASPSTTPPLDCAAAGGQLPTAMIGVFGTSGDFDFDSEGYVGFVLEGELVRTSQDGDDTQIVASDLGSLIWATRALSTGDWVLTDGAAGSVIRVDVATGLQTVISSGARSPGDVEVGEGDELFVADHETGRVIRVDAYDRVSDEVIVTGLDHPTGLALSPDELTLYVSSAVASSIVAFDKDPLDGDWTGPRVIFEQPGRNYQGLNTDACGNVYAIDAQVDDESQILRFTPDGAATLPLNPGDNSRTSVPGILPTGFPPSLRFGSGVGGWERDLLYVSDQGEGRLFTVDVGIVGKGPVWQ